MRVHLGIGDLADDLIRGVEGVGATFSETFFEPVIRLGVTGLSRSGKTVFITSLVANLLDRGRMPQFGAAASGRIRTAYLQPQPDDTVPRFDYESHIAALTSDTPHWPESTRMVSQLRLSMRVAPSGLLGSFSGPRTVHIDIVDYPGEWLLDIGLMDQSYAQWSAHALLIARSRPQAAAFLSACSSADPAAEFEEPQAQRLARAWGAYLHQAREDGFSDCTPGRFLLPGELEGSPVLTFAPLDMPDTRPGRGTLWREMERRFEAYKQQVVKPFFRDHFARIDRQIVLVDVLGAIHAGPKAVEDLRQSMAAVLGVFRPGRSSWLARFLPVRRVDKILLAATKADHLHHSQHAQLTAITEALLRDARDRADFAGAQTTAMSIASLRATVEETLTHDGTTLDCVRGTLLDSGKQAAFYPGDLPRDPARILAPAKTGQDAWLDADYQIMRFAPAKVSLKPGEGPPHIRLDRVADFLLEDKL